MNKPVLKYLSFACLMTITVICNAQSKLEGRLGYGYVEEFHIGAHYTLGKKSKLGLLLGGNKRKRDDYRNVAITGIYNQPFIKEKYQLQHSVVFWFMRTNFMSWDVVSYAPSVVREFEISDKFKIAGSVGFAVNFVYGSETYSSEQFAWPHKFSPNFGVSLLF